jgi:hypothetical protein
MTATYADGSRADVTGLASWKVLSGTGTLAVSASGLVTATWAPQSAGVISGEFQGRAQTRSITVTRTPGTFNLLGTVTFGGTGVPDVRVEVVSGPFAGKLAISDGFGGFALLDVAGDLDLRISKKGYGEQHHAVTVNAAGQRTRFELDGLEPPVAAAGVYTLTIAASTCDASFPPALRTRVYTATITQTGTSVLLVASGADFRWPERPNWFVWDRLTGTAEPGVLFLFNDPWGDGSYTLSERADGDVQLLFGVDREIVNLRATADGFSGPLRYVAAYRPGGTPQGSGAHLIGACRSATVTLTR